MVSGNALPITLKGIVQVKVYKTFRMARHYGATVSVYFEGKQRYIRPCDYQGTVLAHAVAHYVGDSIYFTNREFKLIDLGHNWYCVTSTRDSANAITSVWLYKGIHNAVQCYKEFAALWHGNGYRLEPQI